MLFIALHVGGDILNELLLIVAAVGEGQLVGFGPHLDFIHAMV